MGELELRVQAILLIGERILLAQHVKRKRRYWVLPGGHREPGETLQEALARELDEEIGIRPASVTLFSVSEMLLEEREVLDVVFRVVSFEGEPRLGKMPADLRDRRLESVALHTRDELFRLDFRPAALVAEIASAWSSGEWNAARYLGNLAASPESG